MQIRFERSGGLANVPLTRVVDVDQLGADDQRRIRELVADSRFFELPVSIEGPSAGADRFHYRISIADGGHIHAVDVSEAAVPPDLRPLIQWLAAAARRG
jgi:emfourin